MNMADGSLLFQLRFGLGDIFMKTGHQSLLQNRLQLGSQPGAVTSLLDWQLRRREAERYLSEACSRFDPTGLDSGAIAICGSLLVDSRQPTKYIQVPTRLASAIVPHASAARRP